MLCILPFEEAFYRERGVAARYVGNPVLDQIPAPAPAPEFRRRLGVDPDRPTLALLPGSRASEIARVLPVMAAAAERLCAERPGLQVLVPVAPSIAPETIRAHFAGRPLSPTLVAGRAAEVVGASDAAIVCSGTATLEAGLMLRPFVIVYRVSWLSEVLYKLFAKIRHVGLVNLLAGKRLVPELLQRDLTPERVAFEIRRYLTDDAARAEVVQGLSAIRATLGAPGAAARAAEAVVDLVRRIEERPASARVVTV